MKRFKLGRMTLHLKQNVTRNHWMLQVAPTLPAYRVILYLMYKYVTFIMTACRADEENCLGLSLLPCINLTIFKFLETSPPNGNHSRMPSTQHWIPHSSSSNLLISTLLSIVQVSSTRPTLFVLMLCTNIKQRTNRLRAFIVHHGYLRICIDC